MSDQYDYVATRIGDAREKRLDRLLGGAIKTTEQLHYENGYLRALHDVEQFGVQYRQSKLPPLQEDDEDI